MAATWSALERVLSSLESLEDTMGPKPRRAPQNIPDSLPKRDEGTDVQPDAVRRTDEQSLPPDSLPEADDENSADAGLAEEIARVDSAGRS
jgi:hypothetical protein